MPPPLIFSLYSCLGAAEFTIGFSKRLKCSKFDFRWDLPRPRCESLLPCLRPPNLRGPTCKGSGGRHGKEGKGKQSEVRVPPHFFSDVLYFDYWSLWFVRGQFKYQHVDAWVGLSACCYCYGCLHYGTANTSLSLCFKFEWTIMDGVQALTFTGWPLVWKTSKCKEFH